ncbi:hypothetical protein FSP39_005193 [Pinctada imbricata]|uniref:Uncharacterized protein n=1 Tax=Pinctada imbricata TaxID=66713 RepID=A0AA88YLS0_PINIB|nr:hypothetical protein FSP39_005193 [Pinctada imbricata]
MEADPDLRHLSCGLYQIVSHEIGSEEAIRLRRRMGKVEEELDRIQNGRGRYDFLKSGSRAEGFTFSTSDTDIMVVYKYVHVKMDNKRRQLEYKTVVKTETDQTRPGFCLIRLLSQGRRIYFDVNQACVNF